MLGMEGPLLEFWYRPGSRKHKALDAFFARLFQLQGLLDESSLASIALLWKGTPWQDLDAPEEGSPLVRAFVMGGILAVIMLGVCWAAFELSGRLFLALLGLIVALVLVGVIVRRSRSGEMRRAERLWDRGRYDAAAGRLHTLLAKRPQHEPAWRMYIEYYVRRGDLQAAFACCDAMQAHGLDVAERIREHIARFMERTRFMERNERVRASAEPEATPDT